MATIVTREVGATAKGSPLTNTEVDNNFINLNVELVTAKNKLDATFVFDESTEKYNLLNTIVNASSIETYVQWDSGNDAYTTFASGETQIHRNMRRCLLLDNGTVNYYLDSNNSNLKANGQPSVLTGQDGQVMVEIPKFYIKRTKVGNLNTWFISEFPREGYVIHPAFIKNGAEVNYRYIGAYDACVFDISASSYISGLNWDNNAGTGNGVEVDVTLNTGDKLASVSGIYPMVGLTRAEFRNLAKNRGVGWRQADFFLISAVQLLYLVEYGNFNSQLTLGAGNTSGSYLVSSGLQTDSPHTVAGASNNFGANSTNLITGAGTSSKPGTAFMSYRGIENFFGNCWNWVDGFNLINYVPYVSNNDTHFVDDATTNYTNLEVSTPTTGGYITNIHNIETGFIPSSVGGSSTTYLTDTFYVASGNRVAIFGGNAFDRSEAGAFFWGLYSSSSNHNRVIGARIAF